MHAPHFLHGAVSPETLQWNYSLAGSLGVAQLPLIASLSPAAGLNGRFNRYEMLRVQGSVRTYHGAPASQIVWTLEENTLQRSGLPREFTFAMLVARPGPIHERRVELRVEIEPVLQSWIWCGAYPGWWLKLLRRYRASRKRGVDFRGSVGQKFGTGTGTGQGGPTEAPGGSVSRRGFNFATLVNSFDEYVSWQGKKAEVSGITSTKFIPNHTRTDVDNKSQQPENTSTTKQISMLQSNHSPCQIHQHPHQRYHGHSPTHTPTHISKHKDRVNHKRRGTGMDRDRDRDRPILMTDTSSLRDYGRGRPRDTRTKTRGEVREIETIAMLLLAVQIMIPLPMRIPVQLWTRLSLGGRAVGGKVRDIAKVRARVRAATSVLARGRGARRIAEIYWASADILEEICNFLLISSALFSLEGGVCFPTITSVVQSSIYCMIQRSLCTLWLALE
ncbi:hypothetical protein BDW69DRAFT_173040 [Aspergillus filifer]